MIHNAGLAHASKFAMTSMESTPAARPPTPPRSMRSNSSDIHMD